MFRTHVVYRNAVSTCCVYRLHGGDDCAVKVGEDAPTVHIINNRDPLGPRG